MAVYRRRAPRGDCGEGRAGAVGVLRRTGRPTEERRGAVGAEETPRHGAATGKSATELPRPVLTGQSQRGRNSAGAAAAGALQFK